MSSGSEIAAAAAVRATEAVEKLAGARSNALSKKAVEDAAPEISQAIKVAIDTTPEMQHVLNTEHWWQKRSRWAFIIGIIFTVGGPQLVKLGIPESWLTPEVRDFIVTSMTTLGGMTSSGLALWAGIAKRPLGTKPTLRLPQQKG